MTKTGLSELLFVKDGVVTDSVDTDAGDKLG